MGVGCRDGNNHKRFSQQVEFVVQCCWLLFAYECSLYVRFVALKKMQFNLKSNEFEMRAKSQNHLQ